MTITFDCYINSLTHPAVLYKKSHWIKKKKKSVSAIPLLKLPSVLVTSSKRFMRFCGVRYFFHSAATGAHSQAYRHSPSLIVANVQINSILFFNQLKHLIIFLIDSQTRLKLIPPYSNYKDEVTFKHYFQRTAISLNIFPRVYFQEHFNLNLLKPSINRYPSPISTSDFLFLDSHHTLCAENLLNYSRAQFLSIFNHFKPSQVIQLLYRKVLLNVKEY